MIVTRVIILASLLAVRASAAERLDIAPFARPCCSADSFGLPTAFDYGHPKGVVRGAGGTYVYGLQWAEERDIAEVAIRFRTPYEARRIAVQYWFRRWPGNPPRMPTIEDHLDDPWQGEWLTAKTEVACSGPDCRFTFAPLDESENKLAANLGGLRYRRTLKLRLRFPSSPEPEVEAVRVHSESTLRRMELRVQAPGAPRFTVYNGAIVASSVASDGARLTVEVAEPKPPGSHDVTVVEVHNGDKSFAFAPAEVAEGGMLVPDMDAFVTLASDASPRGAAVKNGARIRERVDTEPEQTYERAAREIPALDPVERQGGRLYLPLAADSSWQKFALEWGGNVAISKRGTKAYGRELERLTWAGDRLSWRIGTGEPADYREQSADSTLATLEDHLPVAIARWSNGGIHYEEEAFATLLSGPLAPDDPGRSEQTPAVLMVRIRARNNAAKPEEARIRLGTEPGKGLAYASGMLTADEGRSVRASVRPPAGASARIDGAALRVTRTLAPGEESDLYLALPFIPGLTEDESRRLASLDYAAERNRVIAYWRRAIAHGMPFRVPEERFNTFARGLLARIRISVTKDPKSGIYIVPAASYNYRMYANEASFQAQLLDVAGHHAPARTYLQGLVDLQGSKPFDGTYTGDQKAIYHGARIDGDYDYTASQYNLDHGTVLWTLAEHYFITRDRDWLGRVAGSMKRAADWVVEQRKLTRVMADDEPCPEYGLLPAGHLEDNDDWGHWFSVNAYASLGLTSMSAALLETGDPDANRYRREADAYRADLRKAVLRAAAAAPVIRLRDNTWAPYVPTRVHQRIRLFGPIRAGYYSRYPEKALPTYRLSATRELLYGPLILVDTSVFDAGEPLARWVIDDWEDNATMSEPLGLHVHGWVDEEYWFSRGGMVFQANLQNPIRSYLRRGEARAAIRGLYNNFVSCYYPSVNVFTEEYRQWRSPSGPFYKTPDEAKFVHRLRDALVTEYNGDLILAAATPARWLAPGQEISVTNAPTHFGPVSYALRGEERRIVGTAQLPGRNPYANAWLYIRPPAGLRIAAVRIDGTPWPDWDRAGSRIRLPKRPAPIRLEVDLHPE
ncbi:MAG: hypothetical protein KIT09_15395 [Bryobacteraceae bacterium]|nr:hypothetical protein [Bryobacteraceae bacterium]